MSNYDANCPDCTYTDKGNTPYGCVKKQNGGCKVQNNDAKICDPKCCESSCPPSPSPSPSPPPPSPPPDPGPPSPPGPPGPSHDTIKCYDPKKNKCIPYGNNFPKTCKEGIVNCYETALKGKREDIQKERKKCIDKCTWNSSPSQLHPSHISNYFYTQG